MKKWFAIQAAAPDAEVATVSITDDIGAWGVTAQDFLAACKDIKAPAVRVLINSPGGSLFDALAMLNGLKAQGKTVTSVVLGIAASAASVFAVGSDRVEMPANSFQFIHNPLTGCYGNAQDMRDTADVLETVQSSMRAMYAKRWKGTEAELTDALAAETYYTAEQCLALGLCDAVTDEMPIQAKFDIERLPEAIRAKFKAPDPEPEPAPVARQIAALAEAAGLADFSAQWAVKFDNVDAAKAAIGTALEIKALCDVAQRTDDAAALITAGKNLADVRAHLCEQLEAEAKETHVSTVSPVATRNDDGPQSIDTRAVYRKINNQTK